MSQTVDYGIELRYADRLIALVLEDGVMVNYSKFGSLLAKVATVHGQKAEGL